MTESMKLLVVYWGIWLISMLEMDEPDQQLMDIMIPWGCDNICGSSSSNRVHRCVDYPCYGLLCYSHL